MNKNNPLQFTEITFAKLKTQIQNYLTQEYSTANILYSEASPFGQLLFVITQLYQLSILYLKNSIAQFDLSGANSNNAAAVKNAVVLAGINAGRALSSTGTLQLSLISSVDISSAIPGNQITIFNKSTIQNKTNGLQYSIVLGTDKSTFKINNNSQLYLNIIQGVWTTQTFTGNNSENQSYQVSIRSNNKDIENFNVQVSVDGLFWNIHTWLYDMAPNDTACVVRTSYDKGVDIIFGNGNFGQIPKAGSQIVVSYLVSDGSNGNIFRQTPNDWIFIDQPVDGQGNSLSIEKLFNISIFTDINYGADTSSVQFLRNLLPISSNNFVLALPEQYAYAIMKLGVFSYVNAYESNGIVYIVVVPNVNLFAQSNSDYFSIPLSAFTLSVHNINKLTIFLKAGGNILLNQRYKIVNAATSLYVMNVFLIVYTDAQISALESQIQNVVSNYFLTINKTSRIPKSELINLISQIDGINSVDVSFISNKNEQYHIHNTAIINNSKLLANHNINLAHSTPTAVARQFNNNNAAASIGYTQSQIFGIDPILGDILFSANEIPLIRGNFFDRNGSYYSDDINSTGLKSINIFVMGTIASSQRPQIT